MNNQNLRVVAPEIVELYYSSTLFVSDPSSVTLGKLNEFALFQPRRDRRGVI